MRLKLLKVATNLAISYIDKQTHFGLVVYPRLYTHWCLAFHSRTIVKLKSILAQRQYNTHIEAGVYIIKIIDIFAPPPFFLIIFFSPSTIKNSSFPLFFHLLPLIFAFFLIKSSYFFPNQPKTHMFKINF